MLTQDDFQKGNNKEEFQKTLREKLPEDAYKSIMYSVNYENELIKLQA